MEDDLTVSTPERGLVFVVGPGRSGTSTMAGALSFSGYTVPQAIKGNETNPLGFFEPRWVVNFHRQLLQRTGVRTLDTDPQVLERLSGALSEEKNRDEVRDWLAPRLEQHGRLVIKDPRMVWFRDLWVAAAQDLGVDPRFVVMLRHPAEVSASRSNYYDADEIPAVAGWINVALMTEQLTAGSPRRFVHYPNLTADWRTELARLRDDLGLVLDPAPEERPHPVDEFIDPKLRRMKPGWEDSSVPPYLQELGDRTFDVLGDLAEHGDSAAADDLAERLQALRAEYSRIHSDALALVAPTLKRVREDTTRKVRRRVLAQAAKRQARQAPPPASPPAPQGLVHRVVRRARAAAARPAKES